MDKIVVIKFVRWEEKNLSMFAIPFQSKRVLKNHYFIERENKLTIVNSLGPSIFIGSETLFLLGCNDEMKNANLVCTSKTNTMGDHADYFNKILDLNGENCCLKDL